MVKDFHFQSLRQDIDPLIIIPDDFLSILYVRVAPGATQEALATLEEVYEAYAPAYPFDYRFVDEDWQALYQREEVVSELAQYFAGLALVISLLGLFGLAAYTAEQRTREIDVRKVLGASAMQIIVLMSRNFIGLVAVAGAVGGGLAYWLMGDWLTNFAYRISLELSIFFGATALTLVVALATVSVHAFRTAALNPVRALKQE